MLVAAATTTVLETVSGLTIVPETVAIPIAPPGLIVIADARSWLGAVATTIGVAATVLLPLVSLAACTGRLDATGGVVKELGMAVVADELDARLEGKYVK